MDNRCTFIPIPSDSVLKQISLNVCESNHCATIWIHLICHSNTHLLMRKLVFVQINEQFRLFIIKTQIIFLNVKHIKD